MLIPIVTTFNSAGNNLMLTNKCIPAFVSSFLHMPLKIRDWKYFKSDNRMVSMSSPLIKHNPYIILLVSEWKHCFLLPITCKTNQKNRGNNCGKIISSSFIALTDLVPSSVPSTAWNLSKKSLTDVSVFHGAVVSLLKWPVILHSMQTEQGT